MVVGSDYYDGWIYQGGAFQLGFNLFWVHLMTAPRPRVKLDEQYRHLPLTDPPLLERSPAGRFYRDWLAHPTRRRATGARCRSTAATASVHVPALNVGGWYDIFLGGTLENFTRMRARGRLRRRRGGQRAWWSGPWAHGSTYGAYPDHSFDGVRRPTTGSTSTELQLRFFERHLRGDRTASRTSRPCASS